MGGAHVLPASVRRNSGRLPVIAPSADDRIAMRSRHLQRKRLDHSADARMSNQRRAAPGWLQCPLRADTLATRQLLHGGLNADQSPRQPPRSRPPRARQSRPSRQPPPGAAPFRPKVYQSNVGRAYSHCRTTRIDVMQSLSPPLPQEPRTSARFGTSLVASNDSPSKSSSR